MCSSYHQNLSTPGKFDQVMGLFKLFVPTTKDFSPLVVTITGSSRVPIAYLIDSERLPRRLPERVLMDVWGPVAPLPLEVVRLPTDI
jgi:hypothetical protein